MKLATLNDKNKRWIFTPKIGLSLITLLLFSLFVYLGCWQLHRMSEKKMLETSLALKKEAGLLEWSREREAEIFNHIEQYRFQMMKVRGKYLGNQNILLDNQTLKGQVGYRVLTPFLVSSMQTILLIDRGWISAGVDRSHLPSIPAPFLQNISNKIKLNNPIDLDIESNEAENESEIEGILNKITTGLILKKEPVAFHSQSSWPRRVQSLDVQELSLYFQKPVYPVVLKLPKPDATGLQVEEIYLGIKKERHLGYAIQWFTLAMIVLIYFVMVHSKRDSY